MEEDVIPLFARQAIYDADCKVVAYELLFRSSDTNQSLLDEQCEESGDKATTDVITQYFANISLDKISSNRKIFINFTRNHLLNLVPELLPSDKLVVEILEHLTIDEPLIEAIHQLRQKNYVIALDDFIYKKEIDPLLPHADIIKVDVLGMSQDDIKKQFELINHFEGKLLAEKVEDEDQFNFCKSIGFDYFQGYFLSKPTLVKGRTINESKNNSLKLISELQKPDVEISDIEKIISHDPMLAYRIMLIANSAGLGSGMKMKSLRDAIVRLGINLIKNWISLLLLSKLDNTPADLVETTVIRAKMCESLGKVLKGVDASSCYTIGMLSTLQSIMKIPLTEITSKMGLSDEVVDALLHEKGKLGEILKFVKAYEKGDFSTLDFEIIDEEEYQKIYLDCLAYAETIMHFM